MSASANTRQVGDFVVTAVTDGTVNSTHDFIHGLSRAETEKLMGVPYGQPLPIDVNCYLVRHGGKLILSDAGTGTTRGPTLGLLPASLRAIGVDPAAIDLILMTHLHADHSFGLIDAAGQAVFPRAELVLHEVEAAFWLDREPKPDDSERIVQNSKAQRIALAPYRGRTRRVRDGEVLPGIRTMLRPGHTPGHTNWLIESKGERLLLWGDIVHFAALQMARPDATLVYDVEPQVARITRERVLDWVTAERLCVAGAHLPFPGFGLVNRSGQGFTYQPTGN